MTSWHSLTAKEVFKKLQTSSEGISDEEAKRRLIKFGRNKLPAKKHFNATALFLRQFKSPLIYLLVLASAVSFFLDEIVDGYIILAAVALAVIFGYLQEQKAENTLDKLEGMVKQIANVLRSGQKKEIDAYKLVPGDLLFIAAGDKIPADVRLVSCVNLEIQEAPLTGESYPVEKSMRARKFRSKYAWPSWELLYRGEEAPELSFKPARIRSLEKSLKVYRL